MTIDEILQPPYPHYSWLGFWLVIRPPRVFQVHVDRRLTDRLLLTTAGAATITLTTARNVVTFHASTGDIGYFARDGDRHEVAITASGCYETYALLLPDDHVDRESVAGGSRDGSEFRALPVIHDTLLRASLQRLASRRACRQVSEEVGDDVAARQIVTQLRAIMNVSPPVWPDDTSVFTPAVMHAIVARVDAHLRAHQTVADVSRGFGLSIGHFARKFRISTGLSLSRFTNRRRISAALARLGADRTPLAQLALDLGFCSQSHFTRSFSDLTGTTPSRFRRRHRDMSA